MARLYRFSLGDRFALRLLVASLSVAALFTAGFLPAVVLALVLMVYVWWRAGQMGIAAKPMPTAAGVARDF